jgi:hypothetical protein
MFPRTFPPTLLDLIGWSLIPRLVVWCSYDFGTVWLQIALRHHSTHPSPLPLVMPLLDNLLSLGLPREEMRDQIREDVTTIKGKANASSKVEER